jgi:hypothetical protein
MVGASLVHLVILAFIVILIATPIATILKRLGFSPWWVILFLIPFVNLISLWVLSRSRWPNLPAA